MTIDYQYHNFVTKIKIKKEIEFKYQLAQSDYVLSQTQIMVVRSMEIDQVQHMTGLCYTLAIYADIKGRRSRTTP